MLFIVKKKKPRGREMDSATKKYKPCQGRLLKHFQRNSAMANCHWQHVESIKDGIIQAVILISLIIYYMI